ncbi:MAG TPA: CopG family transcriptional regulator [Caulobacteraceae bacterium]|jgi:metal-responsive CopG/Arc/MetJ family transcriptional regulator
MRTLVDIPADQMAALTELSRQEKVSRAAIIREAVTKLIQDRRRDVLEETFGAFKGMCEDSVEFQRRLRDDW